MSAICAVYGAEPDFPAADQRPGAKRYTVAVDGTDYVVDAVGAKPSAEDVRALLHPARGAFRAADLLALLTTDDYAAIAAATAGDAALGLLWASMLAQGTAPIAFNAPRFTAGWAGMEAALGKARADELRAGLG